MDFETHAEAAVADLAERIYDPLNERESAAFKAGWMASRDYHRQVAEREIAEAVERLSAPADTKEWEP